MIVLDLESPTIAAIRASYEDANDEKERTYLGGSIIGEACERKLWYGFRWAGPPEKFDGRMLRLFQSGHVQEPRMVDDLRRAGVTVWDVDPDTGEQFGISDIGGHFKGHADGVGQGIIEAPKTPHLLEFKTHSAKSFTKLKSEGMRSAKPLHYAQMQTYMHYLNLTRGLYLAVNKDTDELYGERIHYDPGFALILIAKAERVITAQTPPAKLHDDPDARMSFSCKYCQSLGICHQSQWPRRNCRTCLESTPALDGDGRWTCSFHNTDLSADDQRAGCKQHRYIPDLIPGEQIDVDPDNRTITYALADGTTWIDGVE